MQIIIKTNRNSSYFPLWDLDEHSVEQHVYPSVSDIDHVPSYKKKIQKKVFGYKIIQNYITELYDDKKCRSLYKNLGESLLCLTLHL